LPESNSILLSLLIPLSFSREVLVEHDILLNSEYQALLEMDHTLLQTVPLDWEAAVNGAAAANGGVSAPAPASGNQPPTTPTWNANTAANGNSSAENTAITSTNSNNAATLLTVGVNVWCYDPYNGVFYCVPNITHFYVHNAGNYYGPNPGHYYGHYALIAPTQPTNTAGAVSAGNIIFQNMASTAANSSYIVTLMSAGHNHVHNAVIASTQSNNAANIMSTGNTTLKNTTITPPNSSNAATSMPATSAHINGSVVTHTQSTVIGNNNAKSIGIKTAGVKTAGVINGGIKKPRSNICNKKITAGGVPLPTNNTAKVFTALPNEIQSKVVGDMDWRTKLNFQLTNKDCYKVVSDKDIEAAKNGFRRDMMMLERSEVHCRRPRLYSNRPNPTPWMFGQLFCYGCLEWKNDYLHARSVGDFATPMRTGQLAKGGMRAINRRCLKCQMEAAAGKGN
jgi:hypothetical protein